MYGRGFLLRFRLTALFRFAVVIPDRIAISESSMTRLSRRRRILLETSEIGTRLCCLCSYMC